MLLALQSGFGGGIHAAFIGGFAVTHIQNTEREGKLIRIVSLAGVGGFVFVWKVTDLTRHRP